jgi:GntR family transcriptional regulator/MocR family aminotransferase
VKSHIRANHRHALTEPKRKKVALSIAAKWLWWQVRCVGIFLHMDANTHQTNSPPRADAFHDAPSDAPGFSLAIANIRVDDASPVSIYEQICRAIRVAIASGELPPGTHLPTSRELADALKIGRNTVVTAYSRLAAEGYLLANKRRGTRVADDAMRLAASVPDERPMQPREVLSHDTGLGWPSRWQASNAIDISYHAKHVLQMMLPVQPHTAPFGLHTPDPSLYPRNPLSRLIAEEFCRSPGGGDMRQGLRKFQTVMTNYLRHMRGVVCEPSQIIPVTGIESALDLTARVMIDPGHWVYVEDPAYDIVGRYLRSSGAQVLPLPSDNNGADIQRVPGPPPRLIFTSPSVGFPLGAQMSETRREAMLAVARNSNAVIFECDAMWELSYTGSRIRAMQGSDKDAPVIYFGSLNHTLGPHIRVGYLVVPPRLVEPFTEMAQRISYGPEPFLLAALAGFVEGTDYAVHIKSIRSTYAERLGMLVNSLRAHLPNITILEPCGGLHVAVVFNEPLNERAICRGAAERGLSVTELSRFYLDPARAPHGVVLGFGNLPERVIETMVCRLADVVNEVREHGRLIAPAA